MFLKHTDSLNIELIVTVVLRRFSVFINNVHFIFLFELVVVVVFWQLLTKNSVNVSRRQFIHYKRQGLFYVFTCLGLFRFYGEPSVPCSLVTDLCAVRMQKFMLLPSVMYYSRP